MAARPGAGAAPQATAAWRGDHLEAEAEALLAQAAGTVADPPLLAASSWIQGGGAPKDRRSSAGLPATAAQLPPAARLPTTASGLPRRGAGQQGESAPSDGDRVRSNDALDAEAGAQTTGGPAGTAKEQRTLTCEGGAGGAPRLLALGAGAARLRQSLGAGE